MDTTILQVPIRKRLRDDAMRVARKSGFSSLQDLIRLFLAKYSSKEISVGFEEPPVKLSAKAARRYARMAKDFETGKNVYHATSVEDLMRQLEA